ncbi:putative peptidoglycan binding domain protein [Rhodococcus sp. MTM3W5.2]|uniref:tyrosinase family protein n=1 Tax=Rhodococcus sp. MTM3W5.2 TaxID=1805827 RepID=UPI000979590C|nr:tyrosinase family protein [Rhodococcus sp. MTM3W5.2]AQA22203.1 putative peptidoglycan binding domain protein [Rhodococcus sp. MTM3W5.2]
MIVSALFQGDGVLAAIAAGLDTMSRTRNDAGDAVGKVQTALLSWDPNSLPVHGIDKAYGGETEAAVRRFQISELGTPAAAATGELGPRAVLGLDQVQATAENPPARSTERVRRNVWRLSTGRGWDQTLLAYAQAVCTMQARPADDPTSWDFQANLYRAYRASFADARDGHDGNRFFLPWHRMYLYFFEQILRAAVIDNGGPADFALPYWNYGNPEPQSTLPYPFRDTGLVLPDGSPNPLALAAPLRNADLMAGDPLSPTITSSFTAMWQPSFSGAMRTGFSGQLENIPHGAVHAAIGGDPGEELGALMSNADSAPRDPIFWLHHANLDRLWVQWLERHSNPTDGDWLDAEFRFFDADGRPVDCPVRDVLDHVDRLGYRYDDQAQLPVRPQRVVPVAPNPTLVASSPGPTELTGRTTVGLEVSPSSLPVVEHAPDTAAAAGFGAVLLTVDGLAAQRNPGCVYHVYMNLPDAEVDGKPEHHLAGTFSLFGVDADGRLGFTFDITALVQALASAYRWDPAALTVTVQPVRPTTKAHARAVESGLPTKTTLPLRIGRIGLFVG